jgi:hypothetical protein
MRHSIISYATVISKPQNTMDRLSDESVANGLTPEILQTIIRGY